MQISANTAGIQRGVQRTEKLLGDMSKQAGSATRALRTLAGIEVGRVVVGGITSIANVLSNAARSAVTYASGLAQSIDATAKLAQRTGVAVEALQGLQIAAGLAGVENLEGALQKVTVAIGNAAESGNTKAFENLGIDFALLQSLSPEDQFRTIAAAIAALPTEAERAAAAVKLFGRSGVELLPLFASNLEEIEARAQRLGIVLSGDQTAAIEEMNDALSLVRSTFDGIIGQVVANLAPAITALSEEFLTFVEGFQGIDGSTGGSGLADALTEGLLKVVDVLAVWADALVDELNKWATAFSSPVEKLSGVFEYFGVVVDLLQAAFFGFRGIINGLLIGAAEILKLLPDVLISDETLQAFQEGLDASLTDDFERAGNALAGNRPAESGSQGSTTFRDAAGVISSTVANRNSPEAVAAREQKAQQRTFNRLAANFANAAATAAEVFGDNIPAGVADAAEEVELLLKDAFADGTISEEEQRAIAEAQAAYNDAIRDGKVALTEAEKAAKQRADEEKKRQEQIAGLEERFAEKSQEIEADRLDSLSRASNEALQGNDLRSSEGISQFLALATGREDPAIAEYRKQVKELQDIKREIAKIGAAPVEIVGGG